MFKRLFALLLLASTASIAQTTPDVPHADTRTPRQRARDSFVILDCVPMVPELQQFSTGSILTATSNCVEQGRYADAARLWMLTTVDARFEAERRTDPDIDDDARDLERLLREGHAPADMAGLIQARQALLGDPAARRALCGEIRAFGPPDETSTYRDPLPPAIAAKAFDAGRAWATAVTAALDCRG